MSMSNDYDYDFNPLDYYADQDGVAPRKFNPYDAPYSIKLLAINGKVYKLNVKVKL